MADSVVTTEHGDGRGDAAAPAPSDPVAVGSEGDLPTSSEVVLEAEGLTKHFPVRRKGRAALTGPRRAVQAVDDVTLVLRRGRGPAPGGGARCGPPPAA